MPKVEGIQNVLLDIEGTICPISFVKDTLFPYALKALPDVLATKWDDAGFRSYRDAFAEEHKVSPVTLKAHVEDLTKRDVKIAYLKNLQGYLWEDGYRSGAYSTRLFPDVVPRLKMWKEEGSRLAIYSSGSVFAQKLLFQHVTVDVGSADKKRTAAEALDEQIDVEPAQKSRRLTSNEQAKDAPSHRTSDKDSKPDQAGQFGSTEDMRQLMTEGGWFDTTNAGLKTEAGSYLKIIESMKWEPAQTLFLTDNVKEYDAAAEAGLSAILLDRPGNAPVSEADLARMEVVQSLDDIELTSRNEAVERPSKDSEGSGNPESSKDGNVLQEAAAIVIPAELEGIH